jgi:phenylacetate-CoA ligase
MYRWFVWNVLYRLHEQLKRHPTYSILNEMEAADRLSAADLNALCELKLRQLIDYSYTNVAYVRACMDEAGLKPADISAPADLVRLPLMRKADARQNRERLRSRIAGTLAVSTTGGSTGEPLIFDLSKRRIASRMACRHRVGNWWGLTVGDSELAIWGSPVELTRQDRLRDLRDRFLATRLLSAFEMNEATMSRYLDILERRPCRQIFGYPSAIHLLCQHAQKEGRSLRRLGVKAVFVTGEVLYPYQRELISETLNCPVANGYGGRDSGFIAHECPQGGMHIMADAVIVEIIDPQGRPLPPGEVGEIVVTDLYSHEAPFIRYATGDIGVTSTRRCPCGRALPLLERVEGRSNDAVAAPDGRLINSLALIYPIREVEGIEHFRIVQNTLTGFHIQIVRNERYRVENEDTIRSAWTKLLRASVAVEFEYVPTLAQDKSGKFRYVVCKVPAAQAGREEGAAVTAR